MQTGPKGRLRDECLNEHLFPTLRHARHLIAAWRDDYNHNRPHTSLDGLTPQEYHHRSREDQTLNRLTYKRGLQREQVTDDKTDNHLHSISRNTKQTSASASWRSGYAADCKSVYTGSIPVLASI